MEWNPALSNPDSSSGLAYFMSETVRLQFYWSANFFLSWLLPRPGPDCVHVLYELKQIVAVSCPQSQKDRMHISYQIMFQC